MSRFVISGIGELVTNDGDDLVGLVNDAALGIEGDRIGWVGPIGDLPGEWSGEETFDVAGRGVIPGFVDAHTHLVFAGDRAAEFAQRMRGVSYADIAAEGGGILASVAATRGAPFDQLVASTKARFDRMLSGGTTTIEVKSGYGLDTVTELAMLEAAAAAASQLPITVKRTFLGAHSVPVEYRANRTGYVEHLVEEMLPACASYADYCDVFVEDGVFSPEEARQILAAGAAHGLGSRVHAEQLSHSGGAGLAAEIGAASADHLDHATPADADKLAAAGTTGVLVPGASFQLRGPQAPGPMLWDAGVTVAIATDCNPGTSYIESMSFVIALAVVQMGLTPEQALWASTRGGALSLGLEDRGRIRPGDRADLVVIDAPSHHHLSYRPASNLVSAVIAGGNLVPSTHNLTPMG